MTEPTKEEILEKLDKLTVDQIDRMKDEKLVELKSAIKEHALVADEYLVSKFDKQEELLKENSHNKTEQLLRADRELFEMKRQERGLSAKIKELKLAVTILSNYYWKNKT